MTNKPDHQASIWFLDELDLYKTVKPYRLNFPSTNAGVPRSNIQRTEAPDVPVYDIRKQASSLSYDRNGFAVLPINSSLTAADCADAQTVQNLYYGEVQRAVADFFDTPNVEVLRHVVRIRHAQFPVSTGQNYKHGQPVLMAHVDWTPERAAQVVRQRKKEAADLILKGHFAIVHVWKPLRGPVRDWPLALCDASTVDIEDLEPTDSVSRSGLDENYQVYHRPKHRWFYLNRQEANEALMFRQHDSRMGRGSGVPHAAIKDPGAGVSDEPRESIECHVLVYWESDELRTAQDE